MKQLFLFLIGFLVVSCGNTSKKNLHLKEIKTFEVPFEVSDLIYFQNAVGFAGKNGGVGILDYHKLLVSTSFVKDDSLDIKSLISVANNETDFFTLTDDNRLYKTQKGGFELIFEEKKANQFKKIVFLEEKKGFLIGFNAQNELLILQIDENGRILNDFSSNFAKKYHKKELFVVNKHQFFKVFVENEVFSFNLKSHQFEKQVLEFLNEGEKIISADFTNENTGILVKNTSSEKKNHLYFTENNFKNFKNKEISTENKIKNIQQLPNSTSFLINTEENILFLPHFNENFKEIKRFKSEKVLVIDENHLISTEKNKITIFKIY